MELASGLSPEQMLITRSLEATAHFAVGRGAAKYQDWWSSFWGVTPESSPLVKYISDTSCFLSLQLTAYTAMLSLAGASPEKMAVAIPSAAALSLATSRIYGKYLDWHRRQFGVRPTLEN